MSTSTRRLFQTNAPTAETIQTRNAITRFYESAERMDLGAGCNFCGAQLPSKPQILSKHRLYGDLDILVKASPDDAARVLNALYEFGFGAPCRSSRRKASGTSSSF